MSKSPHDGQGRGAGGGIGRRHRTARRSRRIPVSHLSTAESEVNLPASNIGTNSQLATTAQNTPSSDYALLLTPMFAAMTKITSHLFLTGVGGMTRENFRKNHIDFVVNITTEAPFWEDVESMRLPLEDDTSTNILPYMDTAVDRINEVITKKNGHVLVHCIAGVSRSATVVIGYLMKYKRMDLRTSFNYCFKLRPVIRPNNGFMIQLINYESHLFGKNSVYMIEADVDGTIVNVPHFFVEEHPRLVLLEVMRVKDRQQRVSITGTATTGGTTPATTVTTTTTTTTTSPTQNTPNAGNSNSTNLNDDQ